MKVLSSFAHELWFRPRKLKEITDWRRWLPSDSELTPMSSQSICTEFLSPISPIVVGVVFKCQMFELRSNQRKYASATLAAMEKTARERDREGKGKRNETNFLTDT